MRELDRLLKRRDLKVKFNHLTNRVRCFPHIINICVSHIIALSTRVSKEYLESLGSEGDDDDSSSSVGNEDGDDDDSDSDDNDNDNDNDDSDVPRKIRELKLKKFDLNGLSTEERTWFSGMKRDPVKRARTVVRILRSSDQRKRDFKEVIKNGNKSGWFRGFKSSVVVVPDLEPLRDVKTRWDSTFAMIERLLMLRPVSIPAISCFNYGFEYDTRIGRLSTSFSAWT
jgi:hypothetical protein